MPLVDSALGYVHVLELHLKCPNCGEHAGSLRGISPEEYAHKRQELVKTLREQHQAVLEEYRDLLRQAQPYVQDKAEWEHDGGVRAANKAAKLWSDIEFVLKGPRI